MGWGYCKKCGQYNKYLARNRVCSDCNRWFNTKPKRRTR